MVRTELSEGRRILPAHLAAQYAKVKPATLRTWVHRSVSTGVHHHPGGYDIEEIDAFLARRNNRMIRHRDHA